MTLTRGELDTLQVSVERLMSLLHILGIKFDWILYGSRIQFAIRVMNEK